MAYLHSQMQTLISVLIPIPFLYWAVRLESESDCVQYEKFCIAQCSRLVYSLNRNQNPDAAI